MIAEAGKPCETCGTPLVLGSSTTPHCPECDRAIHALEVRYDRTGIAATFEEIVRAMLDDDALLAGVADEWSTNIRPSRDMPATA